MLSKNSQWASLRLQATRGNFFQRMDGRFQQKPPTKEQKMKKEKDFIRENLTDKPPIPCDFKIGDIVTFTNEFGVSFSNKKIIGFSPEVTSTGRFIHLSKDAYWFPVPMESLKKES